MFRSAFPVVKTEEIVMRKVKPEDVVFYNTLSDPQTSLYEFWEPHRTYEDTLEFLSRIFTKYENGVYCDWTVTRRSDGEPLGMISFHDIFPLHARADIGFWIVKKYRNMGYATKAAKAMIEYGFSSLGFERIQALCATENAASVKVLEKAGMKREALLEKYARLNVDKSKLSDIYMYTIFP
jgi:ribosomal-protein-alanine N-acetyltransferase